VSDKPKKPRKKRDLPVFTTVKDATARVADELSRGIRWSQPQPRGELDIELFYETLYRVSSNPPTDELEVRCQVCGKVLGSFRFSEGKWDFEDHAGNWHLDPFATAYAEDNGISKLKLKVECPKGHRREIQSWRAMRAIETGTHTIRV
jgi:hypothetical protein